MNTKNIIINAVAAVITLVLSIFLCPFIAAQLSDRPFTIAIVWAVIAISFAIIRCIVPICMEQKVPHNIREFVNILLNILKKLFTTKYLIVLLIWTASASSTLIHTRVRYGWHGYDYGYMVQYDYWIFNKWGFKMKECCGHDEYYMAIDPSGEQILVGVDNMHTSYSDEIYCEDLCFTFYNLEGEVKDVLHTNNKLTFKSIDEANKRLYEFLESYSDVKLFFHLSQSRHITDRLI